MTRTANNIRNSVRENEQAGSRMTRAGFVLIIPVIASAARRADKPHAVHHLLSDGGLREACPPYVVEG
jgi:hypothetical protein